MAGYLFALAYVAALHHLPRHALRWEAEPCCRPSSPLPRRRLRRLRDLDPAAGGGTARHRQRAAEAAAARSGWRASCAATPTASSGCGCDGCDRKSPPGAPTDRPPAQGAAAGLPPARSHGAEAAIATAPLSRRAACPSSCRRGPWAAESAPSRPRRHAAHRDRAERAQALDHLLHQHFGRRRAGGQADPALAFEPFGACRSSGASTM